MRTHRSYLPFALVGFAVFGVAQKKVLDHSVYDGWKSLSSPTLSNDGRWIAYGYSPQEGDRVNEVQSLDGATKHSFERGSIFRFSKDSKFLIATVIPKFEDSKKARIARTPPADQPKNNLLILNLDTGVKTEMERITSFTLPEEDSGWFVYRPEPPRPATPARGGSGTGGATPPATGGANPPAQAEAGKKKSDHRPGDTWVLRQLSTGKEVKLDEVVTLRFNKAGTKLVLVKSTKDGSGDGVYVYDVSSGQETPIVKQLGRYPKLDITEDASKIAFVTDKDDYAAKTPALTAYVWDGSLKQVAKDGSAGIKKDWIIASGGALSFSESGRRLTLAVVPKPVEEKPDPTPAEDKAQVDVWNWKDDVLQPQQLLQVNQNRSRTYDALIDLGSGRITQLEDPDMPNVIISDRGDGEFGMISDGRPYQRAQSWGDGRSDIYLVNLQNGSREKVMEAYGGNLGFSPTGRYLFGFNGPEKNYLAIDTRSKKRVTVTTPYPVHDELDDHPDDPPPYGVAGWTKDDKAVLIYDKYDIWQCDPTGAAAPKKLTSGRARSMIYRRFSIDPEERFVGDTIYTRVMSDSTKRNGLVRIENGVEKTLVFGPKKYNWLGKAKDADRVIFNQMDFIEYPEAWVTNLNFENPRKLTNTNPQQAEYNWGTEELVSYRSADGEELQGILFKPENFDIGKKYPMIAYFYERDADTLFSYRSPAPSASTINIPMYVSQGYLVFVPDIAYKVGYPGESAISAINAGVNKLIDRGYVDPKRIGIQGQSWGGYQVAYMITESNMYAAACAGAPVSNMFSAYGGIRWGSGLVRQFQYEKTQSRIGGTPWNSTLRYLENSPVFFADKVKTPLLMMHNDKDGAVPWWQSIEMFTALRRLDKPAWLCVYNEEDHNLVQRKNRKDWSIRMQQFFDHYLKGAPMPKWMAEGVPATDKGKDYGFGLPPVNGGG